MRQNIWKLSLQFNVWDLKGEFEEQEDLIITKPVTGVMDKHIHDRNSCDESKVLLKC